MQNVSERIKLLRKSLNLNQTAFGEKLGVTRSVIKNIELNLLAKPEQKEPLIRLICREFNVDYVWLTTGEGEMYAQGEQSIIRTLKEECGANDRDAKIIEAYLRLPDEYREAIKRFAVNLADNLNADDKKADK